MNYIINIIFLLAFISMISDGNLLLTGIFLLVIFASGYFFKKLRKNFEILGGKAIDNDTHLIWQRFSIGQKWLDIPDYPTQEPTLFTYDEAIIITSNYGKIDNWRLPTIEELKTIVDKNKNEPSINLFVFPKTQADFYWTSSICDTEFHDKKIKIKGICFKKGTEYEKENTEKGYVRLVSKVEKSRYDQEIKKASVYEDAFFFSFKRFTDSVYMLFKFIIVLIVVIGIAGFIFDKKDSNDVANKSNQTPKIEYKKEIEAMENHPPKGELLINGNTTIGQTLSSINNISDEDGLGDFNYQWLRNGKEIDGAKNDTYQLETVDIDKRISLSISYLDGEGTNEIITSVEIICMDKVNHLPKGDISILGLAFSGQTLSTRNTISDEDGLGYFRYQWLRNGEDIGNAINDSYTITESDINQKITFEVSYIDGQGKMEHIRKDIFPLTSIEPSEANDILKGTDSNDVISALAGDDKIIGGLGSDKLNGGSGTDIFQFNDISESGIKSSTRDIIIDFSRNEGDKIDLSSISKKVPLHFIGNTAFSKNNAKGELRFDSTNHILYLSTNSDNKPEFSVEIKDVNNLINDDLILINNSK